MATSKSSNEHYYFSDPSHTQNANKVKEVVLQSLVAEGFISKEDAIKYVENYQVILTCKKWFMRLYDAIFSNRDDDGVYYDVVKIIKPSVNFDEHITVDEDDEDVSNTLSELKFQLNKALSDENYDLAEKLRKKIEKIENKK